MAGNTCRLMLTVFTGMQDSLEFETENKNLKKGNETFQMLSFSVRIPLNSLTVLLSIQGVLLREKIKIANRKINVVNIIFLNWDRVAFLCSSIEYIGSIFCVLEHLSSHCSVILQLLKAVD